MQVYVYVYIGDFLSSATDSANRTVKKEKKIYGSGILVEPKSDPKSRRGGSLTLELKLHVVF